MRRLVIAVVCLAGTAACGGGSVGYGGGNPPPPCTASTATATTSVSLSGMEFVPSCIKIGQGATITFTNADAVDHTVTTDAGQPETFDSLSISPAHSFNHAFAMAAETVHVHCTIHPSMTATIFVQ